MTSVREQLNIPHEEASRLGVEAVAIQERGFYQTESGKNIDISAAVKKASKDTVTYTPQMSLPTSAAGNKDTIIQVRNTTTLDAAQDLIKIGSNPAALNMASATSPGGGFLHGARAQEEYLARSSGLYVCLHGNPMYDQERFDNDHFYDDYVIYSPDVPVFRDDNGKLLETPYNCTIITSPAVMASAVMAEQPQRSEEIEAIMRGRILKVLAVGQKHNHDALVLGAWGCGAFGNDGNLIAALFHEALTENFKGVFSRVIFAIADWSARERFIGPFKQVFE
jgi:uncharacterized protein (TIGR02452 family)